MAAPDHHRRDLWEAIGSGEFPEWASGPQVFTAEQAEGFSVAVLDSTKIVPEELVPVTLVGRMVPNRNPDNFFAETEQVTVGLGLAVPDAMSRAIVDVAPIGSAFIRSIAAQRHLSRDTDPSLIGNQKQSGAQCRASTNQILRVRPVLVVVL